MVQYVLKIAEISGQLAFDLPTDSGAREAIERELEKCREKHNGFVLLTVQPPRKPRTTGKQSQNHHLNGHIMQICNETGNSYEAIKYCVKMLAVEEMGYPFEIVDGHICPKPEHESSTEECAKLIEAAHVWAALHGLILEE